MTSFTKFFRHFLVSILMVFASAQASAQTFVQMSEEVMMLPYDWSWKLETTVYKPEGSGPFPLVIMNHGKSYGDAREQKRYRPIAAAREFVKRGFVVAVPMRLGFGNSGGSYFQSGCDLTKDGYKQSESIDAALRELVKLPYIKSDQVLIVGHSYGGFIGMAYGATQTAVPIKGLINFAGGLKKSTGSCLWDLSLTKAFTEYGKNTKVPSLWIYSENDSLFKPDLVNRLNRSYSSGGAKTEVKILGPFKEDGHKFFDDPEGVRMWSSEIDDFIKRLGF
jgi:dienelactone hydrolase